MEWLQSNAAGVLVTLIIAVIGGLWVLIGTIIWAVTKFTKVEIAVEGLTGKMDTAISDIRKMDSDLADHISDRDFHTTLEEKGAMSRRIERLEQGMKDGFQSVETKIDKWATTLMEHALKS